MKLRYVIIGLLGLYVFYWALESQSTVLVPRIINKQLIVTDGNQVTKELRSGFEIDTSGDQACFSNCPEVGLKIWAQLGQVKVVREFRSCKHAGFGDPYIDGAVCDDENFILVKHERSVTVVSQEKDLWVIDFDQIEKSKEQSNAVHVQSPSKNGIIGAIFLL